MMPCFGYASKKRTAFAQRAFNLSNKKIVSTIILKFFYFFIEPLPTYLELLFNRTRARRQVFLKNIFRDAVSR